MGRAMDIPTFCEGPNDPPQFLLVGLTRLDEEVRAKLLRQVHEALGTPPAIIHQWDPSPAAVHAVAKHHAETWPKAPRDSQANIYTAAIMAYRAGWKTILVADHLTKRQLTGTTRADVSEAPETTVVVVWIRPTESTDHVRVVAKRSGMGELKQTILGNFEPGELSMAMKQSQVYHETGLVLHDPNREPFTPNTAAVLGHEANEATTNSAIERIRRLPQELINYIIEYAVDHGAWGYRTEQIIDMSRDLHRCNAHLNIFLLFPAVPEEIEHIRSMLQQEVSRLCQDDPLCKDDLPDCTEEEEIQVVITPWPAHRHPSREQLVNLWDQYQRELREYENRLFPDLYFLRTKPATYSSTMSIGNLYCDGILPVHLSHRSLAQIAQRVREWEAPSTAGEVESPPSDLEWSPFVEGTELILPPDNPFYVTRPPWEPRSQWISSIPVFYLTNKLTQEQDDAVRSAIYEVDEDLDEDLPKVCTFVPWKNRDPSAPDATIQDIWEMYWEQCLQGRRSTPMVFIDAESGIDHDVMIVGGDFYDMDGSDPNAEEILKDTPHPRVRGMRYGRIVAMEAHSTIANLEVANVGIADVVSERFVRPDWPGNGILPYRYHHNDPEYYEAQHWGL